MIKKIILTATFLLIISCGQKEVNLNEISNRNGLAYQVNSNEPYTGKVSSKLENGQIIVSGNFKDGKKHGKWLEYFNNGQLKKEENFKNGNFDGLVESYNENSQKITSQIYSDNKLNGVSEFYNSNGILLKKASYSDGQLNGGYIENYDNSNPKIIATYKDYKITSKYSSFYQNGNKESEYTINNGNYDGDYIEYNDDGTSHKHYFYKNGNRLNKGTWKKYWIDDTPTKKSGNNYSIVKFDKRGKPKQAVKFYYKNGKLLSEGNYSSIEPDVKEGKHIWYYKDGSIKKKINYKNDKMDGLAESYYEQTNLSGKNKIYQKVNFNDGKLDGKFEYWAGNYQKNKPIILNYYVAQNMGRGQWWKVEGNCKNGKYDGTFKVWWRYRTNIRREPYIMPAYFKHVWQNGNLTWNGVSHGRNEYFNKNGKKLSMDDRRNMLDLVSGR